METKIGIVRMSDVMPSIKTEIVSAESLAPDRESGTHSMEILEERVDGHIAFCKNCKCNHFIPNKKESAEELVPAEAHRDI